MRQQPVSIAAVKFHSHWQPLRDEDAQTALVFGFMRHAPTESALDVWLSDVLGRRATAAPLGVASFWPRYPAGESGRVFTEPDVVIEADDGDPLLVIVECKPPSGQHTAEQLSREAVDACRHLRPRRVAVVLVGADLRAPESLEDWEQDADEALFAEGMADVALEFRYSSWSRLARAVEHAARAEPIWTAYAEDVLFRLRAQGVLDYDGAPVLDDLDGLTLTNAVEAFHRIMRAFRLLALTVHSQDSIAELGLEPYGGRLDMLRDGRSTVLSGDPSSFETSILLVPYTSVSWPDGAGVFLSAWLTGEDGPHLEVGAFSTSAGRGELPWSFAAADVVEELESSRLEWARGATLDLMAASGYAEFVYAERRWVPGDGDGDVAWIIDGLRAGVRAWQGSGGTSPSELLVPIFDDDEDDDGTEREADTEDDGR